MTKIVELREEEVGPKRSLGLYYPWIVYYIGAGGYERRLCSYRGLPEAQQAAKQCNTQCRIIHINLPPMVIDDSGK